MNPKNNFSKQLAAVSAASGFLAVLLGAFGAHGLKNSIVPEMLAVFETGCRYQMIHALAGLALAGLAAILTEKTLRRTAFCWWLGTLIFSGSLYLLALTGHRWWGAAAPVGGIFLMAGWLALLAGAMQKEP